MMLMKRLDMSQILRFVSPLSFYACDGVTAKTHTIKAHLGFVIHECDKFTGLWSGRGGSLKLTIVIPYTLLR